MKRSEVLSLAAAALSLALLCGCVAVNPTAAAASEKHQVAIVAKSTQTEFWKSVFAGAQAAATEYNLTLTIAGPETEEDYETQNQMVTDAVSGGAEVLVFSAIDYHANAEAVNAAIAAGVPVVNIDSGVNSAVSTYIGTDNYAAGAMAAQAALECGYNHLYVGLVNYDVNSANGQERERAVRDTLEGRDDVTIAAGINTLAQAEYAQADTASMLQQHPEINVLIAFNEPTAVGAARALSEKGLGDSTWLVGFDSNVETVDRLQDGVVDALIVQNPYAMGYLGVESAYELLAGQSSALEATVDTATTIVDRSNMFTIESQKTLFAFE